MIRKFKKITSVLLLISLLFSIAIFTGTGVQAATDSYYNRAQYIIDYIASTPIPKNPDPRMYSYYADARYYKGVNLTTAASYMNLAAKSCTGARGDNEFLYYGIVDDYLRFNGKFSSTLKNTVKNNAIEVDYSKWVGSTANKRMFIKTAGYLAAQIWPNKNFGGRNGPTSAQVRQSCADSLRTMLWEDYSKGNMEYCSSTYMLFVIECYATLSQYAGDSDIKQMAKMTLERILTSTAGQWANGAWGSSSLREYTPVTGPDEAYTTWYLAWMMFGGARKPSEVEQASVVSNGYYHNSEKFYNVKMAISRDFLSVPSVIDSIANDKSTSYIQKEIGRFNENMIDTATYGKTIPFYPCKYTYVTDKYGIGSNIYDGDGLSGFYAQLRRWKLTWVSDYPCSTFFVSQPVYQGTYQGSTRHEQIVQSNGQLLTIVNIPTGGGNGMPYIEGPLSYGQPNSSVIVMQQQADWVFCHGRNVLFAFKIMQPYTLTESRKVTGISQINVKSTYLKNSVYVDTSKVIDFAQTDEEGLSELDRCTNQLNRFKTAVLNNTTIDASGINNTNPVVVVTTRLGDKLSATFNGDRLVNGVKQNNLVWPSLHTPYVNQDYNSAVMTINKDGITRTYDWTNLTITQTP